MRKSKAMNKIRIVPPFAVLCCLGLLLAAASSASGAAKPPQDPLDIYLNPIGTFSAGVPFDPNLRGGSEIVAHDPASQRLFVVNPRQVHIDVLDIHNPVAPMLVGSLDLSSPLRGTVNSVACHDGLVAIAVESAVKTDPGEVVFTDANLNILKQVPVGALPDMLTFTPDGTKVLVANEGEPSGYTPDTTDPEGSISIIDLSAGVANATVTTATFTAFNGQEDWLDPSIRIFGPNATVAQDLEPEYIAVSDDSKTAWVTLQENNALAIVDVDTATVTALIGLGFKDHSLPGNELDASDQDKKINIRNWPVKGMYLPDGIAAYAFQGQTYLVLANEGDSRADWPGFNEEARVMTLTLDSSVFPETNVLQLAKNLGRLRVTTANGYTLVGTDKVFHELYSFGARSFSIRTATGELVFDSGSDFEALTALLYPDYFNCSHDANKFDARSSTKGPEPEGVALGKAYGRMLAFIDFERIGGVVTYDVSDPNDPRLVDYYNNRFFSSTFDPLTAGDLGPEGLTFISADNSPTGKPLLVVAQELSGTTTIYEINKRKAAR
jgi:DNA-binding beta-propeller fold protein YncE